MPLTPYYKEIQCTQALWFQNPSTFPAHLWYKYWVSENELGMFLRGRSYENITGVGCNSFSGIRGQCGRCETSNDFRRFDEGAKNFRSTTLS